MFFCSFVIFLFLSLFGLDCPSFMYKVFESNFSNIE